MASSPAPHRSGASSTVAGMISFESVYQRGAETVHEVMGGEPDGSFLLSSELRPYPTGIHFGAAFSRRTAGPQQKSVCLLAWAAQSLADL